MRKAYVIKCIEIGDIAPSHMELLEYLTTGLKDETEEELRLFNKEHYTNNLRLEIKEQAIEEEDAEILSIVDNYIGFICNKESNKIIVFFFDAKKTRAGFVYTYTEEVEVDGEIQYRAYIEVED